MFDALETRCHQGVYFALPASSMARAVQGSAYARPRNSAGISGLSAGSVLVVEAGGPRRRSRRALLDRSGCQPRARPRRRARRPGRELYTNNPTLHAPATCLPFCVSKVNRTAWPSESSARRAAVSIRKPNEASRRLALATSYSGGGALACQTRFPGETMLSAGTACPNRRSRRTRDGRYCEQWLDENRNAEASGFADPSS